MNFGTDEFHIAVALPIYLFFIVKWIRRKLKIEKIIFFSTIYYYLIGLITVTFFPFAFEPSIYQRNIIQLIPFSILSDMQPFIDRGFYSVPLKQIGGNLIMLLPAGFFLQMLTKNYENYASALLVGFSISLAIESLQLFLSLTIMLGRYKIFDVDDLILNTLGFMIGYFIFNQCMKIRFLRNIIKKSEL